MARNDSWVRVKIVSRGSGQTMCLYHTPKGGAAGQDVDRELRAILGIPSPQPKDYVPEITIEALPAPADWLTERVPPEDVPPDHCK